MKVNVMKRENELIIDYIREKDFNKVRYTALEYMAEKHEGDLVMYINTNNKRRKAGDINIENVLHGLNLEYAKEPAERIKRKIIDLGMFFAKKEKKKDMSENMYLIKLSGEVQLRSLYEGLIQYYDYGLGVSSDIKAAELIQKFKDGAAGVLFNKRFFQTTLYDSSIFYRMRMDAPYEAFAGYMEGKLNAKKTKR